jgi:hypothetical protein
MRNDVQVIFFVTLSHGIRSVGVTCDSHNVSVSIHLFMVRLLSAEKLFSITRSGKEVISPSPCEIS